jgi:hypothetical protein
MSVASVIDGRPATREFSTNLHREGGLKEVSCRARVTFQALYIMIEWHSHLLTHYSHHFSAVLTNNAISDRAGASFSGSVQANSLFKLRLMKNR